jgi:phage terminase large subunit
MQVSEAYRLDFAERIRDPIDFQRLALCRRLWERQKEILRSVEVNRSTSVKGCHASGKTYTASGLVPWWLLKYNPALVINTAPTLRQVKVFWNEIQLALDGSEVPFPEATTTGLKIANDRYAIGLSSGKGVNIQSFHSRNLLIIADEAPGIEEDIWDSLQGIMAGGNVRLLKLGNPTVPSGEFFDDFGKNRHACNGITISAFDSPNLAGVTLERLMEMNEDELAYSPWPFLTTRRWVRDFIKRWGVSHPKVRSRVFGEFPPQADNATFPLAWLERAALELEGDELDKHWHDRVIRVGIDVAGPGDDNSVLVARVGDVVLGCKAWNLPDPRGAIMAELYRIRTAYPQFQMGAIMVDTVGIGYHVASHIADAGYQVFGFVAGARPNNTEYYADAKAEAYWGFRERLERKAVVNMTDEETAAEASTNLFSERADGRIEIESKDEAKKRGLSSPDHLEAHVMAFMHVTPKQVTYEDGDIEEISPI